MRPGRVSRCDRRGRTFGTVAGNLIVDSRRRTHSHCRSHRDDGGVVRRNADGAKAVRRGEAPIVARGHHHHDARLPGGFHCLVNRIEGVALDPVDQAVEAAWKAGIVVVVAAGNSGRSAIADGFATIGVPANDPAVITVGATMTELTPTRVDDQIASYSSKGPTVIDHIVKPDLVAPGNAQVSLRVAGSTLDTAYPQYEVSPEAAEPPSTSC